MQLDQLRSQIETMLQRNAFQSCSFLAGKLVTLSGNRPEDVYLLARTYFGSGQPLRAVEVLDKQGLLSRSDQPGFLEVALLACQSWAKAERSDEVIRLSELVFDIEPVNVLFFKQQCAQKWGKNQLPLLALISLELGKAYAAQDNRKKLITWTSACLHLDVRCAEALERLLNVHLTNAEEVELIKSLMDSGAFAEPDTQWLLEMFQSVLPRFDCTTSCDLRFAKLDTVRALPGGPTLKEDVDILALKAEARYNQRDTKGALTITKKIVIDEGGTNERAAMVHIACLTELGKTSELFYFAHKLVKLQPKKALSWYAVGAYYFSAKKFDYSRKFFAKATSADPTLMPAWIALAHAHAMHDESDRAMAIYRTTSRLFPGSHLSIIGTATEYLRMNNVALAENFCQQAMSICKSDPLVFNELGVIYYRMRRYSDAVECFNEALQLCSNLVERVLSIAFEGLLFNLGHALRRLGRFEQAIQTYKLALNRVPRNASGHAALGLTYHLSNQPEAAVEAYHVSLGIRPGETLVEELMDMALRDLALKLE